MANFSRENIDTKNIVTQDTLSIPGTIATGEGVIAAGAVLAFDKTTNKWVNYVELTHGTGLFPLGILKEGVDATSANVPAAILKMGIVNAKDVTLTDAQASLLMIQGIVKL